MWLYQSNECIESSLSLLEAPFAAQQEAERMHPAVMGCISLGAVHFLRLPLRAYKRLHLKGCSISRGLDLFGGKNALCFLQMALGPK